MPANPESVPARSARRAAVFQQGMLAGHLEELPGGQWRFHYAPGYAGLPVSLGLTLRGEAYVFAGFPPFLDGVLPEGMQLEALLQRLKIDRGDCYGQLLAVGSDLVGSLTVEEAPA